VCSTDGRSYGMCICGAAGSGGSGGSDAGGGGGPTEAQTEKNDALLDMEVVDVRDAGDAGDGGDTAATLNGPCSALGTLNCNGHAQQVRLICNGTKWIPNGTCSGARLCDTAPGPNQGSCSDPVAVCVGRTPGDLVCDGTKQVTCGPDLVTASSFQCPKACSQGACVASYQCWGRDVVAGGSPGSIDDFEDGDLALLSNDGRTGRWWMATGPGCTVTPSPFLPLAPVAAGGKNTSSHAVNVKVTGCTSYSPSLNAGFNTYIDTTGTPDSDGGFPEYTCAYDVSKYDGVYFWAVGDGEQIMIGLPMRTTIPASVGGDGSCESEPGPGCWDHYLTTADLTATWTQYSFTWADLLQLGWGKAVPWDAKLVTGISFTIAQAAAGPVDIWIDNVGFYKGSPPAGP